MKLKIYKQKFFICCSLFIILIIGGFLRFYNLNWDEGYSFHPDERNIANAVSQIHFFDQLNPKFFAYGSLPIYFYRLIGEFLVKLTNNSDWVLQWSSINLIGRWFSALFSTITILLVFLLAKKIWNKNFLSTITAFFTAFSPSFIQNAHFATTETLLVFWVILIFLFSLDLIEKPSVKNYLKVGFISGLALSTKISAVSFLIIPNSILFFYFFKNFKEYIKSFLSLIITFLTFAFFSPYVFLDRQKFWESMNYENGVVLGKLKVPYTLQFEKTLPYLFQIKNFFWQIGPLALIGLLGFIIFSIWAIRKKDRIKMIFLIFFLLYFGYVGAWYTKFIRYMLPVLPILIIISSWFLCQIRKKFKIFGNFLIVFFFLINFGWSLSFFTIYLHPQTRVMASQWIYQNIPQGAKILTEHWDDGLPIAINNHYPLEFEIEQLTIYEPDNKEKISYYAEKLSRADYIIINSRRLYGTLMFLPEKYPVTSRYYHLLFSEQLGYTKVAQFTSYPSIFGMEIKDDRSEETFQVYDHPKVIILKNTKKLEKESLYRILEL